MKALPKNTVIATASITGIIIVFLAINYYIWATDYKGRFYPGQAIGHLALSGKTKEEARNALNQRFDEINQAGLSFQYNNRSEKLNCEEISFDSDLSRPILTLDLEKSLDTIFDADKQTSYWYYLMSHLTKKSNKIFTPIYYLDELAINTFLQDNFQDLIVAPANAYFSLSASGQVTSVIPNQEQLGKGIDNEKLFNDIRASLAYLEAPVVSLRTVSLYPSIKQTDLVGLELQAKKIIGRGELVITFKEIGAASSTIKYWKVKPNKITSWLSVVKNQGGTIIALDQEKIKNYIKTEIATEIDKEAILPRFEIKDGKVSGWQSGEKGRQIDLEKSAWLISDNLLKGINETSIIVNEVAAQEININSDLQINEIIGTGHSKFSGSPTNRRKNIKNGADALHGILIKPNEEFSLIKALGAIDASTGYYPELVIKGNKTVPEFGGGLCQIGTTIFRTALSTGLPITMRQNHSYRVSYYEPAGTDATIYDPKPDLRFINDTGNYILIQARIIKDDIYFDFWGTKDGRIATTTYPTIYNIVKPAPTRIIESSTLKPGEKKCTESSHNGADAFFDYKVIYPEGATTTPIHERRFSSHYVPWQGVCLVGKGVSSSPIVASTTPAIVKN